MAEPALTRLTAVLESIGPLAVAVSGGVDSMTLSMVASQALGAGAQMLHAVSPAVPPDATARVERYAGKHGWQLTVIDAGEFEDPRYMANPVDRCFYCKSHLYDAMAARVDTVLCSGTNLDDLGDYRPGLRAAAARGVRHPYVEADVDKAGVRAIARSLGLDDLSALPASPCLSSRVETGIAIDARSLGVIYRVEKLLERRLAPRVARCRIRSGGAVVELDTATLERLDEAQRLSLGQEIGALLGADGAEHGVDFAVYRMGSAFLKDRA